MDIDLEKFFGTVDHDKLMTVFGRTIKDGDVISVVRKLLVNGVMVDDEYEDVVSVTVISIFLESVLWRGAWTVQTA